MRTEIDRRRPGLGARIERVKYAVMVAVDAFMDGFPCNVINHNWVEIPRARSFYGKDWNTRPIHFKCSRCSMMAGFTT